MKYDERENVGSAFTSAKKTAIAWNKKSFNADSPFIAKPGMSEIYNEGTFYLCLFFNLHNRTLCYNNALKFDGDCLSHL